jgi:hypothetical protein
LLETRRVDAQVVATDLGFGDRKGRGGGEDPGVQELKTGWSRHRQPAPLQPKHLGGGRVAARIRRLRARRPEACAYGRRRSPPVRIPAAPGH